MAPLRGLDLTAFTHLYRDFFIGIHKGLGSIFTTISLLALIKGMKFFTSIHKGIHKGHAQMSFLDPSLLHFLVTINSFCYHFILAMLIAYEMSRFNRYSCFLIFPILNISCHVHLILFVIPLANDFPSQMYVAFLTYCMTKPYSPI